MDMISTSWFHSQKQLRIAFPRNSMSTDVHSDAQAPDGILRDLRHLGSVDMSLAVSRSANMCGSRDFVWVPASRSGSQGKRPASTIGAKPEVVRDGPRRPVERRSGWQCRDPQGTAETAATGRLGPATGRSRCRGAPDGSRVEGPRAEGRRVEGARVEGARARSIF